MKQEIKSVGVMSLAKLMGLVGLVFGIIVGVIYALMGLVVMMGGGDATTAGIVIIGMAVAMVIGFPIMYFIIGAIYAIIYNIAAKMMGGIELELGDKK
jgi:hypothetical protein